MPERGLADIINIPGIAGFPPGLASLEDRLAYVRKAKPAIDIEPMTFDLGTARDDAEWLVQGDSLLVANITGALTLKFNERNAPSHNLQIERNFVLFGNESAFYRIFLTNTAQAGKSATLVAGKDIAFRVVQGLPATKLTDKTGADITPMVDNVLETPQNPAGPTVGNTTTAVLAANTSRCYAVFTNDSTEVVYIALGKPAVMNTGIRLNAGGGYYEITRQNLFRGAINGICASGGKVVCVQESE